MRNCLEYLYIYCFSGADMKNKELTAARIVMTALSAAEIVFIFLRSMQSADASSQESGSLLMLLNQILCSLHIDWEITSHFIRKAAHFIEYLLLGLLLCVTLYLYWQKRVRAMLSAIAAGAVVAVCDELIQQFYEGRSCEFGDMLLDTAGVLVGVLIVTGVVSIILKKSEKAKESS